MSTPRGLSSAARTASSVTSWKVARSTLLSPIASRSVSQSSTCQAIASPSRSGSVARTSPSAPASARAIAPSVRAAPRPVSVTMAKPSSGFTDPAFEGRSETWPRVAKTRHDGPSQAPIVFALAGDSTTTTSRPRRPVPPPTSRARRIPFPAMARPPHGGPRSCPGRWCKSVALYAAPGGYPCRSSPRTQDRSRTGSDSPPGG